MSIQFPGAEETIITILVIVGIAVALSIVFAAVAGFLRRDRARYAALRRESSDTDTPYDRHRP
jgi:hypothetical protein